MSAAVIREIDDRLATGRRAEAIDIVYREVDELLLARRFDDAGTLISAIARAGHPLSLLMSALIIARPWRTFGPVCAALVEVSDAIRSQATGDDARDIAPMLISRLDGSASER